MTDALPSHIHLPVCLYIMGLYSRAPKKNTSHGNVVLLQDTTHVIHVTNEEVRAKIQQAFGPHEDLLTIVETHKLQWYGHVSRSWSCFPFIRSGQNHLARHGGNGKKTRQTEEEVG